MKEPKIPVSEKKYYDPSENRLVYCSRRASPDFWSEHWDKYFGAQTAIKKNNWFVNNISKRYLKNGSRILEGGCGLGDKVYSLQAFGFESYGVDFAERPIKLIKQYAPELKVFRSDIRNLPFRNNFFHGYWSFGVIEHFFRGFDAVALEMARVLKPNGYLFISFPYMSPLRRLKSRLKFYDTLPQRFDVKENAFYQFALNADKIILQMERLCFRLERKIGMSGVKGLKDEIPGLRIFLKPIFNSNLKPVKAVRIFLDILLSSWGGHSILLIFKYCGK